MIEPQASPALSPLAPRAGMRGPRLPQGPRPALRRAAFDDDLLDIRPAKPAKPARPHPPASVFRTSAPQVSPPAEAAEAAAVPATEAAEVPRGRSVQRPPAEKTLRAAVLAGLCLNLIAFLMVGLSLPAGPLTRNDALLAAVTLLPALLMLVLGELCRKDGKAPDD